MGETAASSAALEVSVSFGRFENDSLSWEKWSIFSPNKYLEEVGKCATPGSVAEKKAYFEAHYKKIAARKAELMEQEKQVQTGLFGSDTEQGQGDLARDAAEADYTVDAPAELNFARGMEQVKFDGAMEQEMEPNEDDLITIECHSFSMEPKRVQEEPQKREDEPRLDKSEEENVKKSVKEQELIPTIITSAAVCAESQSQLQEDASQCHQNTNIEHGSNDEVQEENSASNPPKNARKNTNASKEKDMPKMRKKPASPLLKSRQITTPKASKPVSASTTKSASHSKVRTAQSTPRSKNLNPTAADSSKKVAPKSLHMSVSPKPACTPASAPASTRKSFIMESMGDKDIVRRAFKMFQNSTVEQSDPPGDEKSPISKQVPSRRIELRVSQPVVTHKENGGARTGAAVQKGSKAVPTSFGLRSNERLREALQHVKKLQEKPNAKGREQTNLPLKSKEDNGAAIKTLRLGRNVKAAPAPASDRQSKLKNKPDKGGVQR